jgi:hypothetical protein
LLLFITCCVDRHILSILKHTCPAFLKHVSIQTHFNKVMHIAPIFSIKMCGFSNRLTARTHTHARTNRSSLSSFGANWKWCSCVVCFTAAYLLHPRSYWAMYWHVISQGSMLPAVIGLSYILRRQEWKCGYFLITLIRRNQFLMYNYKICNWQ